MKYPEPTVDLTAIKKMYHAEVAEESGLTAVELMTDEVPLKEKKGKKKGKKKKKSSKASRSYLPYFGKVFLPSQPDWVADQQKSGIKEPL